MPVIDFHCDTILKIYEDNSSLKNNSYGIDINKLKSANSLAQFFALFIDIKEINDPLEECLKMIDTFYNQLSENKDSIALARNYDELMQNKENEKISAFLTIEEGATLKGELSNIRNFHRLGVKLITLTWNFPNEIGYPNAMPEHQGKGLTPFGLQLIDEMNRLKMIIDVSHLSDGGFYDVITYSKAPFVASHSNARAITNHPRNLDDKMIKLLANKGGVMGINFYGSFLGGGEFSRVDDMIRHIKHIKNVGGIDVLSLGSDFDGIDSTLEIENIGEIHKLIYALEKNNFTSEEIDKILYKNTLRILKEVG